MKIEFLLKFTCQQCLKIFKKPYRLPCGHVVCKEHFANEKNSFFKCVQCNETFEIKINAAFRHEVDLEEAISKFEHLTIKEKAERINFENSLLILIDLYSTFFHEKNVLDLECHEIFAEIRRLIDLNREEMTLDLDLEKEMNEIKEKIDNVFMKMIEKTKEYENSNLNSINLKYNRIASLACSKSKEDYFEEFNEKFRNPLLELAINKMKEDLENEIISVKETLSEMSLIKDVMLLRNFYLKDIPNSFGDVFLNSFWINPFESKIINYKLSFDLLNLCKFSHKFEWKLLYRASRDGFADKEFHRRCDRKKNTLVVIKSKHNSFIFGGYASVEWESNNLNLKPPIFGLKSDPSSFLFSLVNKDNKGYILHGSSHEYSIICSAFCGPAFGRGDIIITMDEGFSELGIDYLHPVYEIEDAKYFLAGKKNFDLEEVEVFQHN